MQTRNLYVLLKQMSFNSRNILVSHWHENQITINLQTILNAFLFVTMLNFHFKMFVQVSCWWQFIIGLGSDLVPSIVFFLQKHEHFERAAVW